MVELQHPGGWISPPSPCTTRKITTSRQMVVGRQRALNTSSGMGNMGGFDVALHGCGSAMFSGPVREASGGNFGTTKLHLFALYLQTPGGYQFSMSHGPWLKYVETKKITRP